MDLSNWQGLVKFLHDTLAYALKKSSPNGPIRHRPFG